MTNAEVILYPGCKWIEIRPTITIPSGATTLTLNYFKNLPHMNNN